MTSPSGSALDHRSSRGTKNPSRPRPSRSAPAGAVHEASSFLVEDRLGVRRSVPAALVQAQHRDHALPGFGRAAPSRARGWLSEVMEVAAEPRLRHPIDGAGRRAPGSRLSGPSFDPDFGLRASFSPASASRTNTDASISATNGAPPWALPLERGVPQPCDQARADHDQDRASRREEHELRGPGTPDSSAPFLRGDVPLDGGKQGDLRLRELHLGLPAGQ